MCFSDILTHLRSLNYALNVEIFTKKWFKIINNLYVNNRQITKFWNCDILAFHHRNFLFFAFSNPDEPRLWGINPLLSGPIRKGMLLLPARCDFGGYCFMSSWKWGKKIHTKNSGKYCQHVNGVKSKHWNLHKIIILMQKTFKSKFEHCVLG